MGRVHQLCISPNNLFILSGVAEDGGIEYSPQDLCRLKLDVGGRDELLAIPPKFKKNMGTQFTLTCDSIAFMSKLEGREGKRIWRMESAVANPAAVPPLVITTLASSSSFLLAVLPSPTVSNLSGNGRTPVRKKQQNQISYIVKPFV